MFVVGTGPTATHRPPSTTTDRSPSATTTTTDRPPSAVRRPPSTATTHRPQPTRLLAPGPLRPVPSPLSAAPGFRPGRLASVPVSSLHASGHPSNLGSGMCGSKATSDSTATAAHGFFPARRLVLISSRNLRAGKKLWAARGVRGNANVRAAQNVREARRGVGRRAPGGGGVEEGGGRRRREGGKAGNAGTAGRRAKGGAGEGRGGGPPSARAGLQLAELFAQAIDVGAVDGVVRASAAACSHASSASP